MYRKVRAKTKKTFAPPDKKSSMDMTTLWSGDIYIVK